MYRLQRLGVCGGFGALLAGCPPVPDNPLWRTEVALANAAQVHPCEPFWFETAERLYAKAQKLLDEGKKDEAEAMAYSAKRLAVIARDRSVERMGECPAIEDVPEAEEGVESHSDAQSRAVPAVPALSSAGRHMAHITPHPSR